MGNDPRRKSLFPAIGAGRIPPFSRAPTKAGETESTSEAAPDFSYLLLDNVLDVGGVARWLLTKPRRNRRQKFIPDECRVESCRSVIRKVLKSSYRCRFGG